MKIADATAAMRAAATELSTLPSEMAHAIHAASAGKHRHQVRPDTWADLRAEAVDPDDLPELDGPMGKLAEALSEIRAAFPTLG